MEKVALFVFGGLQNLPIGTLYLQELQIMLPAASNLANVIDKHSHGSCRVGNTVASELIYLPNVQIQLSC